MSEQTSDGEKRQQVSISEKVGAWGLKENKMKQKHILVVSQYFYPEQFRVNDLCSQWVKRGYRVTVLTGIPNYPQGKFYPGYGLCKKRRETYNGVEMIRIPLIPRGSHGIGQIGRAHV